MGSDGSCDISHIRGAVERVPVSTVLIKSTVPPGTTDLLAAFSVTESNYTCTLCAERGGRHRAR
jgi:UDP-glucose 6-dehydrogenase